LIKTTKETIIKRAIYGAKRYQNADSLMLNALPAYANSKNNPKPPIENDRKPPDKQKN